MSMGRSGYSANTVSGIARCSCNLRKSFLCMTAFERTARSHLALYQLSAVSPPVGACTGDRPIGARLQIPC
ncbi:MAG: hypothetical protein EBE86_020385 [Hormoscilla sp. GUM202]|nr:hypothetical protein [Hormoscilla sp. GM7CHS1pb]MBO1349582.1 hypothetical protein [Hormoscilla sp. GUM202]